MGKKIWKNFGTENFRRRLLFYYHQKTFFYLIQHILFFNFSRAGGNRTPISGFGDRCPTTERQPFLYSNYYTLSSHYSKPIFTIIKFPEESFNFAQENNSLTPTILLNDIQKIFEEIY